MLAKLAQAGAPLESARRAVILVHGRGATAGDILSLAGELAPDSPKDRPKDRLTDGFSDLAFLAPQAPGFTWYPNSFLAPVAQNEPYLSQALQTLEDLFIRLDEVGLPPERVALVGFSQGACLCLEYVARHPRRYGGVGGLSGGLIGPPGTPRETPGSLAGTPVFLGCSDRDPHIPAGRVRESAEVLQRMGARVTTRLYPGLGHTVNEDELEAVRQIIHDLAQGSRFPTSM